MKPCPHNSLFLWPDAKLVSAALLQMKYLISLLLTPAILPSDDFFTLFEEAITDTHLPDRFLSPFGNQPHPLALRAAKMLQLTFKISRNGNIILVCRMKLVM
jgi:hypothetical protein